MINEQDHYTTGSNKNIWWYNTQQRRRVFVNRHDDHFTHIEHNPSLYGVETLTPTQQQMKEHLYQKGWVRLRYANNGELNAESANTAYLRKAVEDAFNIHPSIHSVYLEILNGSYWILVDNDIDAFTKFGRLRS